MLRAFKWYIISCVPIGQRKIYILGALRNLVDISRTTKLLTMIAARRVAIGVIDYYSYCQTPGSIHSNNLVFQLIFTSFCSGDTGTPGSENCSIGRGIKAWLKLQHQRIIIIVSIPSANHIRYHIEVNCGPCCSPPKFEKNDYILVCGSSLYIFKYIEGIQIRIIHRSPTQYGILLVVLQSTAYLFLFYLSNINLYKIHYIMYHVKIFPRDSIKW